MLYILFLFLCWFLWDVICCYCYYDHLDVLAYIFLICFIFLCRIQWFTTPVFVFAENNISFPFRYILSDGRTFDCVYLAS